jgi:hypothetical protein
METLGRLIPSNQPSREVMRIVCRIALLAALAGAATFQAGAQQAASSRTAQQSGTPPAASKAPTPRAAAKPATPVMTNRDVIRLVKAKISDDIIINKIKHSKTHFDTSTEGLVALKEAGVSDQLISIMVDPGSVADSAEAGDGAQEPAARKGPALRPGESPSNAKGEYVARNAGTAPRTAADPAPAPITQAPQNYGMFVDIAGQLKPLGRIETKVQVSKFRSFLGGHVPFVRRKIDINLPGAHSSSRYEVRRPVFYAYFPPSRDVSKFKLL